MWFRIASVPGNPIGPDQAEVRQKQCSEFEDLSGRNFMLSSRQLTTTSGEARCVELRLIDPHNLS